MKFRLTPLVASLALVSISTHLQASNMINLTLASAVTNLQTSHSNEPERNSDDAEPSRIRPFLSFGLDQSFEGSNKGMGFHLQGGMMFNRNWGMDIGIRRLGEHRYEASNNVTTDFDVQNIEIGGRYHTDMNWSEIQPYFTLGVGLTTSEQKESGANSNNQLFGAFEPSARFGAGVEYVVWDNVAVFTELAGHIAQPGIDGFFPAISLGVRYQFGGAYASNSAQPEIAVAENEAQLFDAEAVYREEALVMASAEATPAEQAPQAKPAKVVDVKPVSLPILLPAQSQTEPEVISVAQPQYVETNLMATSSKKEQAMDAKLAEINRRLAEIDAKLAQIQAMKFNGTTRSSTSPSSTVPAHTSTLPTTNVGGLCVHNQRACLTGTGYWIQVAVYYPKDSVRFFQKLTRAGVDFRSFEMMHNGRKAYSIVSGPYQATNDPRLLQTMDIVGDLGARDSFIVKY